MHKRFAAILLTCIIGFFSIDSGRSVAVDINVPRTDSSVNSQDGRAGLLVAQTRVEPAPPTQPAEPQAPPQPVPPSQPAPPPQPQAPAQPQIQPQPVPPGPAMQPLPVPPAQPVPPPQPQAPAEPQIQPQPVPPGPAVQPPPQMPQPQPARQPAQKRGEVSFNFDDADIYSVIQTIFGDVLRVNYIVDPRVKGRVTFRSVEPVAKEDVLPLMEVILRLNGVGVVEEAGLYRLVPIGDLPKEPATIGIGREAEKINVLGKALVQVVPIKYTTSTEMIRILTPFLSANAVIVDVPKSNHIVIVDTDDNVKKLMQLVGIFDSDFLKQTKPQVYVYPVQNSKAKDVAALLQQIFQGGRPQAARPPQSVVPRAAGQPQPAATPQAPAQPQISLAASGAETVLSEITKIIADETTNSIIVFGPPEDYELISETIHKIDIAARQVLIEGLIVRVELSDNLSFGVFWSMNTDVNISGLKPFVNPIDLAGNINSNASSFTDSSGKFPVIPGKGFTFVGTDPTGHVRAVVNALQDKSKAKVIAAPHILVADNREARIQIGQQIPIATSTSSQPISTTTVSGTSTTGTGVSVVGTSTIQYKDIGIILKVKPQVNDSGLIALELSQEVSNVAAQPVQVGGLDEVAIDKVEATSDLVARDGETIIIGGLIREDTSHATSGIPFLSSIPIIGALFGSTNDTKIRTELIILLTPHVIRNEREAEHVTSGYIKQYEATAKDKDINKFIKEHGGVKEQQEEKDKGGKEPQKNAP